MKIYYARPVNLYNSPAEQRDKELLEKLGFTILDPNKSELSEKYKKEGMAAFYEFVKECDALAFRACPDGAITAGVFGEIDEAIKAGKPVIEIPCGMERRVLTISQTREYLKDVGIR